MSIFWKNPFFFTRKSNIIFLFRITSKWFLKSAYVFLNILELFEGHKNISHATSGPALSWKVNFLLRNFEVQNFLKKNIWHKNEIFLFVSELFRDDFEIVFTWFPTYWYSLKSYTQETRVVWINLFVKSGVLSFWISNIFQKSFSR